MTHQKILAMLAGHDAQNPMAFGDLVKKSGLLPATLNNVLQQMFNSVPASVNCAQVTKRGITQMVYWPTGVVNARTGPQGIVINQVKKEAARSRDIGNFPQKVKPTASTTPKETNVTTPQNAIPSREPGLLNTRILGKIIASPGIGRKDLITWALSHVKDATEDKIKSTLGNLTQTDKVRNEGKRGSLTYWPKDPAPAAAVSPFPKQEASAITAAEAKPLAEAILHAAAQAAEERSDYFGLNIDDENNLFITIGENDLRLDPSQTLRLHRFMGRLSL